MVKRNRANSHLGSVRSSLEARNGEAHSASDKLTQCFYAQLYRIAASLMRREPPDCSLQATILVHDAYMALEKQRNVREAGLPVKLAAAAKTMRRILIDHARSARRQKRGGKYSKKLLPPEVADVANPVDRLELTEAIAALREQCPQSADIVEMKFFGGMSHEEIGQVVGLSERTVGDRWRFAKRWLYRAMTPNTRSSDEQVPNASSELPASGDTVAARTKLLPA